MKNINVSVILIAWAWHTQVIRTNQHGANFQAEVTCVFRTDNKGVTVILFLTKGCHAMRVCGEILRYSILFM